MPLTPEQIAGVLGAVWYIVNSCQICVALEDIPLAKSGLITADYLWLETTSIESVEVVCSEHRAYNYKDKEFHVI